MGRSVQRAGDANSAGGIALGGVGSVRVNGRAIAVPGMLVTPHRHGKKIIPSRTTGLNASSTVRAGGKPVVLTGGIDACKHARRGGSADVKAV